MNLNAAIQSEFQALPHVAPRKILVKEVNWLGDLVMSLPALRAVRDGFPEATLAVLVKAELSGFFDGVGWVDEVIPYRAKRGLRAWPANWSIVRDLRSRNLDVAILFPNSFESALWVALAKIPERVGYATDGRRLMLTRRLTPALDAVSGHQSRYWLGIARDGLGVTIPEGTLQCPLEPNHEHLARMRTWLGDHRSSKTNTLIAVAPVAAYGPAKEWPAERFSAIIDLLAERHNADCVLVGTGAERQRCEAIASALSQQPIVAAGDLSLGESIALLSLCDGFVGNDSGAMHLAAALGLPTVGIFGSTNPIRTGPHGTRATIVSHPPACSPCLERTCRFGHYDCLKAISVEEVASALARLGAFAAR